MKLRAKLPADDANGLEGFESEARDNFNRGRTIPVIALLATEDVHLKGNVPILVIDDIEAIPDDRREHLLEIMGAIKSERTGRKTGAVPLDIGDEEQVDESASQGEEPGE